MVAQFIADKCPLVHDISVAIHLTQPGPLLHSIDQYSSSTQAHKAGLEMGNGILITDQQFATCTQCFLSREVAFQSQTKSSPLAHNAFLVGK